MRASDLAPGDRVVHDRDRYRVLGRGELLDGERRLTPASCESLGIEAAAGKGGATQRPRLIGRGSWSSRSGLIAVSDPWTGEPDPSFVMLTSCHDIEPEAAFLARWHRQAYRAVQHPLVIGAERVLYVATSTPEPPYDSAGRGSSLPLGSANLLHDRLLVAHPDIEPAEEPWLGDPVDQWIVVVEDDAGARFRVAAFRLVRDNGRTLAVEAERRAEAVSAAARERLRDALRAVARGHDDVDRAGMVRVTARHVTVPYSVLEALALGDEFAVASVLDGVAMIRDELADAG